MRTSTFSALVAALLTFGAPAALARGQCVKFTADGYGDNIGTAKDQAQSHVRNKAEVWARGYILSGYKQGKTTCGRHSLGIRCDSIAMVCRSPRTR